MVGHEVDTNTTERDDDWLNSLLNTVFFGSCQTHQGLRKNEENVFCIDCNVRFCRHCLDFHRVHRRLQICKYVYQEVVRLQDIQEHFDCNSIQTYKVNGEKAVHLNSRPQSKEGKSLTKAKLGASCEACGRSLQDPLSQYCSIACKLSPGSLKTTDQTHNAITFAFGKKCNGEQQLSVDGSTPSLIDTSKETQGFMNLVLKPGTSFRKRKRKGVPHRAPFW